METIHREYRSERLRISPLAAPHAHFIQRLLNTEGWLRFIGNRYIHSLNDAQLYIARVCSNPDIMYWVVSPDDDAATCLGLVTFIKRSHLEHPDIGFAFLPEYEGKGYAREASTAVMQFLRESGRYTHLSAITVPDNERSIALLRALGFERKGSIKEGEEDLELYECDL